MTDHLPECPTLDASPFVDEGWDEGPCICDRLRACEQRVYDERNEAWVKKCRASERHALDAAREAVAGLPVIKEWWEAKGDYVHGIEDALAAIDALKGEQA